MGRKPKLSHERVIDAALAIADEGGLAAVTMASVGRRIGVEAMSLYRHVANKEAMLDGLVDRVFAEIVVAPEIRGWRAITRARAVAMRDALRRHPWSITLMESRAQPGPATLAYHDAMTGVLLRAGFDGHTATRVYNLIDSYVYGFALQEAALPFTTPEEMAEMSAQVLATFDTADAYPNLATVQRELVAAGFDYAAEFEAGLDIIMRALPRPRRAAPRG